MFKDLLLSFAVYSQFPFSPPKFFSFLSDFVLKLCHSHQMFSLLQLIISLVCRSLSLLDRVWCILCWSFFWVDHGPSLLDQVRSSLLCQLHCELSSLMRLCPFGLSFAAFYATCHHCCDLTVSVLFSLPSLLLVTIVTSGCWHSFRSHPCGPFFHALLCHVIWSIPTSFWFDRLSIVLSVIFINSEPRHDVKVNHLCVFVKSWRTVCEGFEEPPYGRLTLVCGDCFLSHQIYLV